jgi:fumarate reductase flavoprotein subunit
MFADPVFNQVIPTIMARQTTGLDVIAGATYTFVALINAVEDALVSGGADLAALREGPATALPARSFVAGTYHTAAMGYYGPIAVAVVFSANRIESITVTAHEDTPMFANMAFNAMIPAMIAAQDFDVDLVAGATTTAFALTEAVYFAIERAQAGIQPAPAGGTGNIRAFHGEAEGYYDLIEVIVIFDGDNIVSIVVIDHIETPMFADMAFNAMLPAMLATQSYNVDLVAGATFTSTALRDAVQYAVLLASE